MRQRSKRVVLGIAVVAVAVALVACVVLLRPQQPEYVPHPDDWGPARNVPAIAPKPATADARLVAIFGDEERLLNAEIPSFVEVFRIVAADDNVEGDSRSERYKVLAGPVRLTEDDARIAANLFTVHSHYENLASTGCIPLPGVMLRYHRGTSHTDVLVCFECFYVAVSGRSWESFHPEPLIPILRRAFPEDPVLADLKMYGDPRIDELFGGYTRLNLTFRTYEGKIDVYRVSATRSAGNSKAPNIAGYDIRARLGRVWNLDFYNFQEYFTSAESYAFDEPSNSSPLAPEYGLRFRSENATTDALLNLTAGALSVVQVSGELRTLRIKKEPLIKLLKQALPDDAGIQALTDN